MRTVSSWGWGRYIGRSVMGAGVGEAGTGGAEDVQRAREESS